VNPPADEFSSQEIVGFNINPAVLAAITIGKFEGDKFDQVELIRDVFSQVNAVHRGDMRRPEAMLTAQAHTLDVIFNTLAFRGKANADAGYIQAAEQYMRLALKAQSQCRTTLETLGEIKNPRPVAFVKQANIANGPQQVNNNVAPARAGENINQSNELSRREHELLPDSRASSLASAVNQEVETVAEIYRPAN
jgi:hypothetical protein